MRCIRSILRRGRFVALTLACLLAVHGVALAQMPEEEQKGGSYVISYALVLVGIGLGVFLVCRTARRRERARPQQYEQLSDL